MAPPCDKGKPSTRHQARVLKKKKEDKRRRKRMAKIFNARKVVGPNDILVDRNMPKIKVEPVTVVGGAHIKSEVGGLAGNSGEVEGISEENPCGGIAGEVHGDEAATGETGALPEEARNSDNGGEGSEEKCGGEEEIEVGEVEIVKEEVDIEVRAESEEEDVDVTGTEDEDFFAHIVSFKSLSGSEEPPPSAGEAETLHQREAEEEDDVEILFVSESLKTKEERESDPNVPTSPKRPRLTTNEESQPMEVQVESTTSPPLSAEDCVEDLIGEIPSDSHAAKLVSKRNENVKKKNNRKGGEGADEVATRREVVEKLSASSSVAEEQASFSRQQVDTDEGTVNDNNFTSYSSEMQTERVESSKSEDATCCQFDSLESIETFMETVDMSTPQSSSHPFFKTKSVLIKTPVKSEYNDDHDDLTNFWDCAVKLFNSHGNVIRNLSLDIDGSHPVTTVYKWIKQLLLQVHNLRSLELKYQENNPDTRVFSITGSLPGLPHLESLNLESAVLPTVMTYIFLETYSSTLAKLHLPIQNWNQETAQQLAKLKELHLTQVTSTTTIHIFKSLQRNASIPSGLASLSLALEATLQANDLFGMLKPFKGLKEVKILLADSIGEASRLGVDNVSVAHVTPKLPSVLSLTIIMNASQRSFGFLKWLPSLESFHLEQVSSSNYGLVRDEKVGQIDVELRKCLARNSCTNSRIWGLLPSVKLITVKWARGLSREITTFHRELGQ